MTDFSFRPHQRLLNARDFQQVFDHVDIKINQGALLLLVHRTSSGAPGRLGLIVAKRNLKRANARNQVKRQIRESFRLHQAQLQGLNIIVMTRPSIQNMDIKALRNLIDQSWTRLLKKKAGSESKSPPEDSLP